MSDYNKDQVEKALNKIRVIFEKASTRLESTPKGGKIPGTVLANDLAKEFGIKGEGPALYPTLKFLFEDYPNRINRKGAHGGLYHPTDEEVAREQLKEAAKLALANPTTIPTAIVNDENNGATPDSADSVSE